MPNAKHKHHAGSPSDLNDPDIVSPRSICHDLRNSDDEEPVLHVGRDQVQPRALRQREAARALAAADPEHPVGADLDDDVVATEAREVALEEMGFAGLPPVDPGTDRGEGAGEEVREARGERGGGERGGGEWVPEVEGREEVVLQVHEGVPKDVQRKRVVVAGGPSSVGDRDDRHFCSPS